MLLLFQERLAVHTVVVWATGSQTVQNWRRCRANKPRTLAERTTSHLELLIGESLGQLIVISILIGHHIGRKDYLASEAAEWCVITCR